MNIDNLKTIAAIRKVVDAIWDEQKKDFETTYNVEVKELPVMIRTCEVNKWTKHIFYNLMIIKNCKFYK
jgi:hypothetical protein